MVISMADLKSCDIHHSENNVVKADDTVKIYVERAVQVNGKTKKLQLFVGQSEGIDACHKDFMNSLVDKMNGIKTPFTWKIVSWTKTKNSDGTEKLEKVVEDYDEHVANHK